jgi:RNA polymerase sigma-70 factor (ECF subfamily)
MPVEEPGFQDKKKMTDAHPEQPEFTDIYDRYFAKVYNYIRYRIGDPAATDDVASRVFEKALTGLESYDPHKGPIEAWLFGIARNVVIDHFRTKRWRSWLSLDAVSEKAWNDPKSGEALLKSEDRQEILIAMELLGEREREILALKFGAGMTNRAIAGQTGLNESNVGVILYRTIKTLRVALRKNS